MVASGLSGRQALALSLASPLPSPSHWAAKGNTADQGPTLLTRTDVQPSHPPEPAPGPHPGSENPLEEPYPERQVEVMRWATKQAGDSQARTHPGPPGSQGYPHPC